MLKLILVPLLFITMIGVTNSRDSSVSFKNNSKRLVHEFNSLTTHNSKLKEVVHDINRFTNLEFNKSVLITHVFRTRREQDRIYRNSKRYKARRFKSPHQLYHAVDIRSWTFAYSEIKKIKKYVNDKYNHDNYYRTTLIFHSVGKHGWHLHLQLVEVE